MDRTVTGDIVAFVRARTDEIEPRTQVEVHESLEGIRAVINEFEARDDDVDLMLGGECQRQREWAGLRLAVRLFAAEHAAHPEYQQEWAP